MTRLYLIYAHYDPRAEPCCYEVFADSKKHAKEKFNRVMSWLNVYYVVPTHITTYIPNGAVCTRKKHCGEHGCFYDFSYKDQQDKCMTCDKAELCINHCYGCKYEIYRSNKCAECNRLYGKSEYIHEPWWKNIIWSKDK